MTDEADDADERELAEARALAATLDGEPSEREPPEDALAAALLLRHGRAQGELSHARAEAILGELLQEPGARGKLRWLRLAPWGAGLALAAAVALVVIRPSSQPALPAPRSQAVATALPPLSVRLLNAQSALVREGLARDGDRPLPAAADSAAAARFERELQTYRSELFRRLESAYPASVGRLERAPRRLR